jgi:Apea-like HEPN
MKSSSKTIIFCLTELQGKYAPNDSLVLYPCSFPNAPRSKYSKHFPIVLEYNLDKYPLKLSTNTKAFMEWKERQIDLSNCLARLLSALTNHHFFKEDEIIDSGIWGIAKTDEVDIEAKCQWVEERYFWPEIDEDLYGATSVPQSKRITAPIVSTIDSESDFNYYFDGEHPEYPDEIVFPDCASKALYAYTQLDTKTQIKIDAITQLIDNGLALIGRMKSLSFLSFVSAIEALQKMTQTEEVSHCEKCGQLKYEVSKRFVDFLSHYVSDSDEDKKIYKQIYNMRSDIAHKGGLLLGDAHQNWSRQIKQEREFKFHKITAQIARLSLVNWLLYNQKTIISN